MTLKPENVLPQTTGFGTHAMLKLHTLHVSHVCMCQHSPSAGMSICEENQLALDAANGLLLLLMLLMLETQIQSALEHFAVKRSISQI